MQTAAQPSGSEVTVQVSLPNVGTKAGSRAVEEDFEVSLAAAAELDFGPLTPSPSGLPSCHGCSGSCGSCLQRSCSNELLVLFLLGWLFLPLWWAGAVMGFLRGRRSLTCVHRAAWRGCMVMSVVGTALLLAFAIHYGPGDNYPDGLQEHYLALSSPSDSLPDLHSNTNLALFATALHTTLELPQSYPASSILTRLAEVLTPALVAPAASPRVTGRRALLSSLQERQQAGKTDASSSADQLASNPAPECKPFLLQGLNQLVLAASGCSARRSARRMLLQDPASTVIAVLGVKFPPGPGLPREEVLAALLVRNSTMRDLSVNLAAGGFVAAPADIRVALSDSHGYPIESH
uniref:Uncharacterized protein n=1 Tax=Tetradesmus obliquus TaxID=3088 RepID=A0A383W6W0_TETOB|eukprot:jgi/Sobl393_1/12416/SZX72923.1